MAVARYVLSLDADRDLDALLTYLATHSGADRAAAVFDRIDEILQLLAVTPTLGRVRRDLDGGPRSFVVMRWVVFYEPMEGEEGIYVWRVIDGSRDLGRTVRRPRLFSRS